MKQSGILEKASREHEKGVSLVSYSALSPELGLTGWQHAGSPDLLEMLLQLEIAIKITE